jgi:diadenosine tetraphosphate (Ap4A) HIT family hydrolase
MPAACALCDDTGGLLLWRDDFCRIVRVADNDYPGFLRVVLNRHVSEMTDLEMPARTRLMNAVYASEQALRELLRPVKINLASLGNQVAHLHWHVVARSAEDRHFPGSVWSVPLRAVAAPSEPVSDAVLRQRLAELLTPE